MRGVPGSPLATCIAAIALGTLATTCDRQQASDDSATGGVTTTAFGAAAGPEAPISAMLNASGATFPMPFYTRAIATYKQVQPGVTVNYSGGGSGKGRRNFRDGTVDLAGTDGLVRDDDKPQYQGEFFYIPTIAAPITVSYNLPGVEVLNLDADTTARIFQRDIKSWNDSAIALHNPGTILPSTAITVVHRSDSSGTTENFTKYLLAAAPNTWDLKSASTVEWPLETLAEIGNQGVAAKVKSTEGAIGYVDLSDAMTAGVQNAMMKNRSGNFVAATAEGATAALARARVKADLTYNPLNADGADAYPITAPTWMLVYKNQPDQAKGAAIQSFLRYLLTDGQKLAASVHYAELPADLKRMALAQVDRIVVP